ncbi:peptidoglycan-associated lipoprotein Pal [Tepidimonas alkaliphilus]|nr:peptidoglycan-associated lipoprotein Pal [Tepidimonas alkaliphilus]
MNAISPLDRCAARVASRWLGLAAAVAILAGCSSVRLDDQAPVADRQPTTVPVAPAPAPAGDGGVAGAATGSAIDPRNVAPVQASAADQGQPPAQVARVIYFDFDSYTVKPEFMATLQAHARYLNADRKRRVVLEGHTDERGGREYNLALGQKRADAVRRALALLGVQDEQMESVSYGKEKPAVQGSGEEVWSRNRRVEIVYR